MPDGSHQVDLSLTYTGKIFKCRILFQNNSKRTPESYKYDRRGTIVRSPLWGRRNDLTCGNVISISSIATTKTWNILQYSVLEISTGTISCQLYGAPPPMVIHREPYTVIRVKMWRHKAHISMTVREAGRNEDLDVCSRFGFECHVHVATEHHWPVKTRLLPLWPLWTIQQTDLCMCACVRRSLSVRTFGYGFIPMFMHQMQIQVLCCVWWFYQSCF